jgi:hypothetical protein
MGYKLSVRTVTGFGDQIEVQGLVDGQQVIGFYVVKPGIIRTSMSTCIVGGSLWITAMLGVYNKAFDAAKVERSKLVRETRKKRKLKDDK